MSLHLRNPRRLLALVLIPACLALAACGGGEEAPDTQVVVPEATTPAPETTTMTQPAPGETAQVAGFLTLASEQQVRLLTEDGQEQSFLVDPDNAAALGIDHMASHANAGVGFLLTYEYRDDRYYVLAASEIAPPFPYPGPGGGE